MSLLSLIDVRAGYGSGEVVHGVTLDVAAGEMVALVGPNGAGKSTLLKAVAGVAQTMSGKVLLEGRELSGLSPALRAGAGAAFLPQERNVFRSLTVAENLAISALHRNDAARRQNEVLDLLRPVGDLLGRYAGRLSGGQRQMVALAMALMARPRALLVDEPTAGLAPQLVTEMLELLSSLAATGLGVLIVEQNARAALERADRGVVLVDGKIAREGPGASLANEPDFGSLFFGEAA